MLQISTLSNQLSLEQNLDKMNLEITKTFEEYANHFFGQIKREINGQFDRLQSKKKTYDVQIQKDIEEQISLIFQRVDHFKIHMNSLLMSLQYQNPVQQVEQKNAEQNQKENSPKIQDQKQNSKAIVDQNDSLLNQRHELMIEFVDDDFLVDLQFSSDNQDLDQSIMRKNIISDSEEGQKKQTEKQPEEQLAKQNEKQDNLKPNLKEIFLIDDNQSRMLFQLADLPEPKNAPKFPYIGPDKGITEIGEGTITNLKVSSNQKDIQVNFYTWADETSWRDLPKINKQIKLKVMKAQEILNYVEDRMKKPHFLKIVGWVFPQDLKDLLCLHEITQQLERKNQCGTLRHLYDGHLILVPYKILIENKNFKDFEVPKPFVRQSQSKDFYLSKYWGQVHSDLCFIYFVKDTSKSAVFGYNFISGQNQEIIKNTQQIEQWIFKKQRINEIKEQIKSDPRYKNYDKVQKRIQKAGDLKRCTTSKNQQK